MSSAPRPGIARGAYPQRADSRGGAADRVAHVVRGGIARLRDRLRSPGGAFVRAVAEAGAPLADLGSDAFDAQVRSLREGLVRRGPVPDLLAPTFALVREAARRTLGMPHYDVQLLAGWTMARGMLAEMETGEGKTLAATLPACTAALAGVPVHVLSSNDYLVERDAEQMGPLYRALGLRVGAAPESLRDPAARRRAWRCDVTYTTCKGVAFDYLRDRLRPPAGRWAGPDESRESGDPLLRGLCFAIVDEADHILIDEARTPLILARRSEAASLAATCEQALAIARELVAGRDFRADPGRAAVELTDRGRARVVRRGRDLGGLWRGPRRSEEWAARALVALHLYQRDRDYLVRDDRIAIIDQSTGRLAADRSWEGGLHQLVEVKEGCPVTAQQETLARISVQQFFRRYLRLAGTTGTAREVAAELWSTYGLHAVRIPTRKPSRRRRLGTRLYTSEDAKWGAVAERVRELHGSGRAVLVGTGSVADSRRLGALLAGADLPHRILSAAQDADEATVVAEAGRPGCITVATSMAGRGTDIALSPEVAASGGLHVLVTLRAEARRIDRQLQGRSGRQGDPGSHEALLSLDDEPVRRFFPAAVLRFLSGLAGADGQLSGFLAEALTRLPQLADEGAGKRTRRSLTQFEEQLDDLLAFAGARE